MEVAVNINEIQFLDGAGQEIMIEFQFVKKSRHKAWRV